MRIPKSESDPFRKSALCDLSSFLSFTELDPSMSIAFVGDIGLQRDGSCPFWTFKAPIDDCGLIVSCNFH